MAEVVCRKRSFGEGVDAAEPWLDPASQPAHKKSRCSLSVVTPQFAYSPPVQCSPVDQLRSIFPDAEIQLLGRVLKESHNDLGLAVKRLHELRLEYSKGSSVVSATEENSYTDSVPLQEPQAQNNQTVGGSKWVDLIVNEMISATSIDDAKLRAATVVDSLVKSISSRASAQVVDDFQKENSTLNEQKEVLVQENVILKRAVAIQHERQKENDMLNQELHRLKQLAAQYREHLQTLEMNNYALKLHLSEAQNSKPMPGRLHPDVF